MCIRDRGEREREGRMKVNEDFLYIIVNCISKEASAVGSSSSLPAHGTTKASVVTPRGVERVSKPSTPRLLGVNNTTATSTPSSAVSVGGSGGGGGGAVGMVVGSGVTSSSSTSNPTPVANANGANTNALNTERMPSVSSSVSQVSSTTATTPSQLSPIAIASFSSVSPISAATPSSTSTATTPSAPPAPSASSTVQHPPISGSAITKNTATGLPAMPVAGGGGGGGGSGAVTGGGYSDGSPGAATTQQIAVSPFDFIYSEKGFSNLKKWFSINATGNTNQFNENQFITFLRELTDLGDHQILEVFDTFDHNHQGAITFNEFFLIISLLVARETGQTTRFLYLHGKEIFEMLMGKEGNAITFEEFSRLGFIIGLTEDQVFAILKDFNLNLFNPIYYEDFMLYYYAVFDEWDKGRKAHQSSDVNNSSLSATGSYSYPDKKQACIIS
eukprot:TRINITY_DN3599_c0_g1_i1.p1 TRINITY_DN3599_c0_g1~~TRINITY_DN3599_c0_g1_i1.p1  ORF type:complete len:445 (-),score=100.73 TRINITY_DN3599_c0_g1_i1:24-1358(-)